MPPAIRSVKKHVKARQRRRLKARERLERDRRQAQHAAMVLEQALHDLGLPANLVAEIEGRLRSQQQLLGKIVGMMFHHSLAVAPTPSSAAYGAGIKTCPRICSARCLSAPGSSDCDAGAWRSWSHRGAMPPARVKPRGAGGSGPGWVMTRCSKSMAISWDSSVLGGVGRNTGCSQALMGCCWSWSLARASWWCLSTLPSVGPTL